MSISRLRTLVTIADSGSFGAAAERLHMTQSAVSMQMKTLEETLRVELFDRSKKPSVLNNSGWRMIEEARDIVHRYDLLFATAASPSSELAGVLRVGVIPSISSYFLPKALWCLQKKYPDLRLDVQSSLSPQLTFMVEAMKLDFAVVTESDFLGRTIAVEHLGSEELKLVVHRDLARGSVSDMLKKYPFVRFNPAQGVGRIIEATLKARGISVNDVLEVDSLETIISIVKLKLGITIIPVGIVSSDLTSELQEISFDPPETRKILLIARHENIDTPAVNAVAEAFRALLKTLP